MIKFSKTFKNFKIKSKIEPYVLQQLLHLNLINMRFYGAEYNNIKTHIAQKLLFANQYVRKWNVTCIASGQ